MIRKIFYLLNSFIINVKHKKDNVKVAMTARIKPGTDFGSNIRIGANSWIKGSVDSYSFVGPNCRLSAHIGKFCSIGPGVKTVAATHGIEYLSSSPVFWSMHKQCGITFANKNLIEEELYIDKEHGIAIEIGNDVWIGEDVLIKGGIKIGDGAVIGMGSIVTKDVEPFSIVAGGPAKLIKWRFPEMIIKKIYQIEWWNQDEKWLRENSNLFQTSDIALAINTIRKSEGCK